jgi:hypothetical protein
MNFEGCNAEIQGGGLWSGHGAPGMTWKPTKLEPSPPRKGVYGCIYKCIYNDLKWFQLMSTFFAALCCQVAGRKMVATWGSLTVLQRRQQVVHLGLDLAKRRCRNFQLFGKFLDHRSGWGVTGKIWNRLQQISWNLRHILELEPTWHMQNSRNATQMEQESCHAEMVSAWDDCGIPSSALEPLLGAALFLRGAGYLRSVKVPGPSDVIRL